MKEKFGPESWVYIIVGNSNGEESFIGLNDPDQKIDFIPIFKKKEEAEQGIYQIPKEKGMKYEIQAVPFDGLMNDAKENGFLVFLVDENGKILEKFHP